MTVDFELYRDEEGVTMVKGAEAESLVATFFQTDVQDDVEYCDEIMRALMSIDEGETLKGVFVGNAHVLVLDEGQVQIESQFDEDQPPYQMSASDFKPLLSKWSEFISAE